MNGTLPPTSAGEQVQPAACPPDEAAQAGAFAPFVGLADWI
jgi:hypothetical protein